MVFAKRRHVDLAKDGEIRSLIPPSMKRNSTLDMSLDGQLKVKQRTIIHSGQSVNQHTEEYAEEEIVQNVYHIVVEEVNKDEDSKGDVNKAILQLEDRG